MLSPKHITMSNKYELQFGKFLRNIIDQNNTHCMSSKQYEILTTFHKRNSLFLDNRQNLREILQANGNDPEIMMELRQQHQLLDERTNALYAETIEKFTNAA